MAARARKAIDRGSVADLNSTSTWSYCPELKAREAGSEEAAVAGGRVWPDETVVSEINIAAQTAARR
jgi:hypothetical protein